MDKTNDETRFPESVELEEKLSRKILRSVLRNFKVYRRLYWSWWIKLLMNSMAHMEGVT